MNTFPPLTNPYNTGPSGWMCPKCGRVYAPMVQECYKCNNPNHVMSGFWPTTCGTTQTPMGYAPQNLNETKDEIK